MVRPLAELALSKEPLEMHRYYRCMTEILMPIEQLFTQTQKFKTLLNQFQTSRIKKDKIVSAEEAVRMIRDNDTIVFGGFAGVGACEEIASELEKYYLETGSPKDLTLMFAVATGPGNDTNKGLNHLGHEGLIKRIIGGHWGLAPRIQKLAVENKVVAYNLPRESSVICTVILLHRKPVYSLMLVLEPLSTQGTVVANSTRRPLRI